MKPAACPAVVSLARLLPSALLLAAAMPLAAQPLRPPQKLTIPDDAVHDDFGTAVAVDGDLAVVGTPGMGKAGPEVGAVHVFTRQGTAWTLGAELFPSPATPYGHFGSSVAISGKVLAAGALGPYGNLPGAVGVFRLRGATWGQEKVEHPADLVAGCYFGTAVALEGTLLAVGAPGDASLASPCTGGAVYLFRRDGKRWRLESKLVAPPPYNFGFGTALALEGGELAVGMGDSKVFVFSRDGAGWGLRATVEPPASAPPTANFGTRVALAGGRLAVTAPAQALPVESAVYVFRRQGGGTAWAYESRLRPVGIVESDRFASSVALAGNLLLVGAPLLPRPGSEPHSVLGDGVVFAFPKLKVGWGAPSILAPADNADVFGDALALRSNTLLVGAPTADPQRAAAYSFPVRAGGGIHRPVGGVP